mmetsp:Transcript_87923/g.282225  ORF Transcript_87923/g.282225 Transcript_87923/m.282225 type:complete len:173 (+) Transcript_87923:85-603(+)
MASKAIKAELLRSATGDVIYMEAGGNFVDELLHVMSAPVGAVMHCSASQRKEGESRSALETLCGSVAELLGPLFNTGNVALTKKPSDNKYQKDKERKKHRCDSDSDYSGCAENPRWPEESGYRVQAIGVEGWFPDSNHEVHHYEEVGSLRDLIDPRHHARQCSRCKHAGGQD